MKIRPSLVLLLLSVIFFLPIFLAYIFYKNESTLGEKTINHGQLITPPISIETFSLLDVHGLKVNKKLLDHKWVILLYQKNVCEKDCQKKLFFMRQIRLAMGKDMDRVSRAIVLNKRLASDFSGVKLFIPTITQADQIPAGTIFLIDPLGNIMMKYNPNSNPDGIYKDLKRLLNVSQIG